MSDAKRQEGDDRDRLREAIDRVDEEIARLLNERAGIAIEIGRIKKRSGEKLFDPAREQDIFSRLIEQNAGPLSADALVRIFERIIDESRRVERLEAYDK